MVADDQAEERLGGKKEENENKWEKLRAERQVTVKIIAPVRDMMVLGDES